ARVRLGELDPESRVRQPGAQLPERAREPCEPVLERPDEPAPAPGPRQRSLRSAVDVQRLGRPARRRARGRGRRVQREAGSVCGMDDAGAGRQCVAAVCGPPCVPSAGHSASRAAGSGRRRPRAAMAGQASGPARRDHARGIRGGARAAARSAARIPGASPPPAVSGLRRRAANLDSCGDGRHQQRHGRRPLARDGGTPADAGSAPLGRLLRRRVRRASGVASRDAAALQKRVARHRLLAYHGHRGGCRREPAAVPRVRPGAGMAVRRPRDASSARQRRARRVPRGPAGTPAHAARSASRRGVAERRVVSAPGQRGQRRSRSDHRRRQLRAGLGDTPGGAGGKSSRRGRGDDVLAGGDGDSRRHRNEWPGGEPVVLSARIHARRDDQAERARGAGTVDVGRARGRSARARSVERPADYHGAGRIHRRRTGRGARYVCADHQQRNATRSRSQPLYAVALRRGGRKLTAVSYPANNRVARGETLVVAGVLLCAFVVGAFAGRQFAGQPRFYQNEFGPAVMLAAGRGLVSPLPQPGAPLAEFLAVRRQTLEPADFADVAVGPLNQFQQAHRYLLLAVGVAWRLSGIAWANVATVSAVLFALSIAACYGICRLWLTRTAALAGAAFLTFSPTHLEHVPLIRDYAKAPFILIAILLTMVIAVRSLSRRMLWILSAACGLTVGVGLGFRMDVVVMAPIFLVSLFAFTDRRPWSGLGTKGIGAGVFLIALAAAAAPVVFLVSRGGSNGYHAILLGYADQFDAFLGINRSVYSYLPYYSDDYLIAAVNRLALKNTGQIPPVPSPAYDDASRMY